MPLRTPNARCSGPLTSKGLASGRRPRPRPSPIASKMYASLSLAATPAAVEKRDLPLGRTSRKCSASSSSGGRSTRRSTWAPADEVAPYRAYTIEISGTPHSQEMYGLVARAHQANLAGSPKIIPQRNRFVSEPRQKSVTDRYSPPTRNDASHVHIFVQSFHHLSSFRFRQS